jgi:hypothetical protein
MSKLGKKVARGSRHSLDGVIMEMGAISTSLQLKVEHTHEGKGIQTF